VSVLFRLSLTKQNSTLTRHSSLTAPSEVCNTPAEAARDHIPGPLSFGLQNPKRDSLQSKEVRP
jgi:hypothetical protein